MVPASAAGIAAPVYVAAAADALVALLALAPAADTFDEAELIFEVAIEVALPTIGGADIIEAEPDGGGGGADMEPLGAVPFMGAGGMPLIGAGGLGAPEAEPGTPDVKETAAAEPVADGAHVCQFVPYCDSKDATEADRAVLVCIAAVREVNSLATPARAELAAGFASRLE